MRPVALLLVFLGSCEPQTGGGDLPRITLEGGVSDAGCPDGQVNDPAVGACVPVSEFFGTDVCPSGDIDLDAAEDVVQELTRAEYCCFTQNNLVYWCPMNPAENIPLGKPCYCPDSWNNILWAGITCDPT